MMGREGIDAQRHKGAKRWDVAACVVICLLAGCATGPKGPPALQPPGQWVRVGQVAVDAAARCVVATVFVNMVDGPLELLVCGAGGKRHESAFVLEANPVDLQGALLLIGAKAGPPMPEPGFGPPRGSRVLAWVRWTAPEGVRVEPLYRFAWNTRNDRPLPPADWVFTGSTFENGRFKALAEESLLASYWDPWAILNIDHPIGADDEALLVNTNAIPPLHHPVELLLHLP